MASLIPEHLNTPMPDKTAMDLSNVSLDDKGHVPKEHINTLKEPAPTPNTTSATIPVVETSENPQSTPDLGEQRLPPSNLEQSLSDIKTKALEIQAVLDTQKEQEAEVLPERFQIAKDYLNTLNEDNADIKGEIRDASRVTEKEQYALSLYNEILQKDEDHRSRIEALEKNPEGKSMGALNAQINQLERDYSRQRARDAIAYNIALGDFQAAEKAVNDRIADIDADRQNRLDGLMAAYNFLGDDLTESEKAQVDQQFDVWMNERKFEQDKEIAMLNDQLTRERNAIAHSRALQLKTLGESGGVAGFGSPVVQQQKADFANKAANLINHAGLDSAVGSTPFNRGFFAAKDAITGDRGEFIGDVENILDTLTLNTFAEAKARGLTFGAMSQGEWDILAATANTITKWRKYSGKGEERKVVGYDVSEKRLKKELDTIAYYAALDYAYRGGDPQDVGAQMQADGTYWMQNSEGNFVQLLPYEQQ